MMTEQLAVDPNLLREEVKSKYRDVAINPSGEYHFHTGRPLAKRLGYHSTLVDSMPDAAVESFAGVANPFSLRLLERGERVLAAGSGGGFDCFVAAHQVGPEGKVIGIDMLPECSKARRTAESMGLKMSSSAKGFWKKYRWMTVGRMWSSVTASLISVISLTASRCPRVRYAI
jgi:arsenite methyltransferase